MNTTTERVAHTRTTPIYGIGAVSRLTGISIVTLRWIEKQGLVSPARSDGRHRLFSDEEIELLNEVRSLLDEHVNLPGIRMILRLRLEIRDIRSTEAKAAAGSRRANKRIKGGIRK